MSEGHTGKNETCEYFGGVRYRTVAHVKSKDRAVEIQNEWKQKGYNTHREQEDRSHWNVYARKKN